MAGIMASLVERFGPPGMRAGVQHAEEASEIAARTAGRGGLSEASDGLVHAAVPVAPRAPDARGAVIKTLGERGSSETQQARKAKAFRTSLARTEVGDALAGVFRPTDARLAELGRTLVAQGFVREAPHMPTVFDKAMARIGETMRAAKAGDAQALGRLEQLEAAGVVNRKNSVLVINPMSALAHGLRAEYDVVYTAASQNFAPGPLWERLVGWPQASQRAFIESMQDRFPGQFAWLTDQQRDALVAQYGPRFASGAR